MPFAWKSSEVSASLRYRKFAYSSLFCWYLETGVNNTLNVIQRRKLNLQQNKRGKVWIILLHFFHFKADIVCVIITPLVKHEIEDILGNVFAESR